MKRSYQEIENNCAMEQKKPNRAFKDLDNKNYKNSAPKFTTQNARISSSGNAVYSLDSLPKDMVHLGGENFLKVTGFLGHTRVHIRRHACDDNGLYHPTKDGISLSPKVWHSFCREVNNILNHRISDKVFVIDRDLCVSKQMEDGIELFVFQRLFQRKNLSMQFVPEHVVLRGSEMAKLVDNKNFITECVKDALITYTLFFNITNELSKPNWDFKPDENCDGFLQLIESLGKCLCISITRKIVEIINCFGCRDHFQVDFMHDCMSNSRTEQFDEYFEQALFQINLKDVAKDFVQNNLNVDFNFVLEQQEFFDAVDTKGLFKSIKKMYIAEANAEYDELIISM